MADVSEIEIYRDGGTLEFRVSGSDANGFYRLQTPIKGTPRPLFKDGLKLDVGSPAEVAVLGVLRGWLAEVSTDDVIVAMVELDDKKRWFNPPEYLREAIPIYYIRSVIHELSERCT
jgi:hypothetical protein